MSPRGGARPGAGSGGKRDGAGRPPKSFTLKLGDAVIVAENGLRMGTITEISRRHITIKMDNGEIRIAR